MDPLQNEPNTLVSEPQKSLFQQGKFWLIVVLAIVILIIIFWPQLYRVPYLKYKLSSLYDNVDTQPLYKKLVSGSNSNSRVQIGNFNFISPWGVSAESSQINTWDILKFPNGKEIKLSKNTQSSFSQEELLKVFNITPRDFSVFDTKEEVKNKSKMLALKSSMLTDVPIFILTTDDITVVQYGEAKSEEKEVLEFFDKEGNFYSMIIGPATQAEIESILASMKLSESSDWQTYRNEEYGFEFSYPEDKVVPDTPVVVEGPFAKVIIVELGMGNGISIFPRGEFDSGIGSIPVTSDVIIGGKVAKKMYWSEDAMMHYHIIEPIDNWITCNEDLKNCNRIALTWETLNQLKLLEQILSTFKFLIN